jgi:hypothetical protein
VVRENGGCKVARREAASPHGMCTTLKDQVNEDLLGLIF